MEIQSTTTMAAGTVTENKNQLSVDDFLKIMSAEIQNQNPTGESGSGSKTDYLTQLAQFTTLEQMNSISEGIDQLSILSQTTLLGKTVTIQGAEEVKGLVEKVKFYNNQAYLQVDGVDYPIGLLTQVEEGP